MKATLAIALILAVSALGSVRAQGEAQGVIEGTVVTGTAETAGGALSGLETTLVIWQHGPRTGNPQDSESAAAGTTERRTTLTDATGAFRFEGLPTESDYVYRITASYASVDYSSDGIQLTADEPVASLELPVYETTTDAGAIQVVLDHLAIQVDKGAQTIQVLNYVKLHNSGDRTLVTEGVNTTTTPSGTVQLPLPKEASNITPIEGLTQENLSLTDGGLTDSTPFPPGDREVVISYDVPYSAASYVLERSIVYPTDKLAILMPAGSAQIESPQLPNRNETEMEGNKFLVMTGENLEASAVQLSLSGLPKADGGIGAEMMQALVLIVAVVALVGALAYWRLRPGWAARAGGSESA